MKTILLILSFFFVTFCKSQSKGDNTILVKGVTFDQVVNALLDSGYRIDKIQKDFKTVKTEYRDICSNCVPQMIFDIRVKDSIATIKGTWRSDGGILGQALTGNKKNDYIYFDIQNIKGKIDKYIFNKMDSFARSFSGIISYAKQ